MKEGWPILSFFATGYGTSCSLFDRNFLGQETECLVCEARNFPSNNLP